MSVFKSPDGQWSSKRFMGVVSGCVGVLIGVLGAFSEGEIALEIVITVLGYSLACLGVTSLEKFGKPEIVRPDATTNPDPPGNPPGPPKK